MPQTTKNRRSLSASPASSRRDSATDDNTGAAKQPRKPNTAHRKKNKKSAAVDSDKSNHHANKDGSLADDDGSTEESEFENDGFAKSDLDEPETPSSRVNVQVVKCSSAKKPPKKGATCGVDRASSIRSPSGEVASQKGANGAEDVNKGSGHPTFEDTAHVKLETCKSCQIPKCMCDHANDKRFWRNRAGGGLMHHHITPSALSNSVVQRHGDVMCTPAVASNALGLANGGGSTGTISSDDSNRRQKSNTEGKWSQKDDIIDNNSGQVESDSDDESDDGWPQDEPELCAKHEVPKSRCSHCQDKRFWVNRAGGGYSAAVVSATSKSLSGKNVVSKGPADVGRRPKDKHETTQQLARSGALQKGLGRAYMPRDEHFKEQLDEHPQLTVDGAKIKPITSWSVFDGCEQFMRNVTTRLSLSEPTPMASIMVPLVRKGLDIKCVTTFEVDPASLMLPIINGLMQQQTKLHDRPTKLNDTLIAPHALVLTKELTRCTELFNVGKRAAHKLPIKVRHSISTIKLPQSFRDLEDGCDLLCANIARIGALLDVEAISLKNVRYLVLDVADQKNDEDEFIEQYVGGLVLNAPDIPKSSKRLTVLCMHPHATAEIERVADVALKATHATIRCMH